METYKGPETCRGRIRNHVFIPCALVLLATIAPTTASAAGTPSAVPGQDFNLAYWKLQLPVAASGGVQEISSADLMGGYTSSYFSSGADGSMTFWCPVTGATTQNSHYPRSELREAAPDGDWSLDGHHEFSAVCRVLSVSSVGRVIIGQIHGHVDGSEIVKLEWDNGSVYAAVEPDRASEKQLPLGNYKLGDTLKYKIEMTAGILKVTLGAKSATYSYTASTWKTDTYYFKAGSYVQDNAGPSSEGAKVAFYKLDVVRPTSVGASKRIGGGAGTVSLSGLGRGRIDSDRTGWRVLFSTGRAAAGQPGVFDPSGRASAY
jgi:hypothetical protein